MARRLNSIALANGSKDTALAVERPDLTSKQIRPATNHTRRSLLQPDRALNRPSQNRQSQKSQTLATSIADDMRTMIRDHRLDEANRIAATLLDQRIADGDSDLSAASMLLQHYDTILSWLPPLSHIGVMPLRPNDRLYACFDQLINLIRQQQSQVSELQAIIGEWI